MRTVLAVLLLVSMAHAHAHADAPASDEAIGLMHFQAGQKLYQDRRYQEAIAEFSLGYHLTHRAAFLLNIAQAHRQLGQLTEARDFYKQFLGLEPSSPLAPQARQLLGDIEAQIAAAQAQTVAAAPSPTALEMRAPASPVRRKRYIAGWTGVGLSLATFVAAGVVEGLAASSFSSLKGSCAPPNGTGCSDGQIDSLALKIDAANGLFITGGILAAGTLIAFLVERARR